jgi:hypothetical protein
MKTLACTALLVLAVSAAGAGPNGTAPRTSASRYPAHAEAKNVSVGAALLTKNQVRDKFASDINECCIVVEFAVYPNATQTISVSLNDFTLRVSGTDAAAKPSSAKLAAVTLQQIARTQRTVALSPTVGVGYGTGPAFDPVTGLPRGGVTTVAGVGVGVGNSGTRPGASDQDRQAMEIELSEKGLPEGKFSTPVAGYLYFEFSPKQKKVTYQLEYAPQGSKVVLSLPR